MSMLFIQIVFKRKQMSWTSFFLIFFYGQTKNIALEFFENERFVVFYYFCFVNEYIHINNYILMWS